MIGTLRQRVTLQTATLTPDGAGGNTATWTDTATLFASVQPLTGLEKLAAEQLVSQISYRVLVRAGPTINAGQRLLWQGRILNIEAVLNVAARDRLLALLCREGGAS